jgi:23S rRNA pseudouridine955/2504/2580 synthase
VTNNSETRAFQLQIEAAQAGQRIDNFLLKHLKGVPKSHIYRLLRSGQVRVNSGRIKPNYRLKADDRVRIPPVNYQPAEDVAVPDSVLKRLQSAVLYEDEDIICLNKPAGIAVHKGSGLRFGIIEAMRQLRPAQNLELVHRLDRDTSGCLLLAKNRSILDTLHQMLRHERTVHIEKHYLALLDGNWNTAQTIDIGISKIMRGGEHIMVADPSGDRAISHFQPVEYFSRITHCTLSRVKIDTGRTHQIRVHAQYAEHPIIGDSKYGNKESNKTHRELGLKRLLLHAESLYIPLDQALTIKAPLGADFTEHLEKLR